jgi:hypothetical protein
MLLGTDNEEASATGISVISLGERKGSCPERSFINLELRGLDASSKNGSTNGEEADWSYEEIDKTLVVRLAENAGAMVVGMSLPTAL